MKKILFCTIALVAITTSCNRNCCRNELVKETYIHKYGVPVSKAEWNNCGKEGQVVKALKDGITVTENYENGALNGKTTYSFSHSSTVQKVELFEQGTLIAATENYPSGVPMSEECFNADGTLSKVTTWYEDGSPAALETYENNLLVYGEYRNNLNVLESRIQDGQGVRMIRTNDGVLAIKDIIQNGQMIERVTYFATGEPSSMTTYENELMHGVRMTFLTGGLPNTVEQWEHGKQEGLMITYQNGEKIAEIPYHQNKKHGIEKRFRDGLDIVEEITWINDLRHGPSKICIEGAEKTDWYHEGELVSRVTFERLNVR